MRDPEFKTTTAEPPVLFEDEHLLVLDKPSGMNTHAPAPFANEGIHEWLKRREPRWNRLAIIHRLDKETSGVMVFGKTQLANQSLTEQFARRLVRKTYALVTDRSVSKDSFTVQTKLARIGEKYASSEHPEAQVAITEFRKVRVENGLTTLSAHPVTGRTHQIRVHASERGIPILGDTLYGGTPAPRLHLHAAELEVRHPAGGKPLVFAAPVSFEQGGLGIRQRLILNEKTNSCRLVHGASDLFPWFFLERWGDYLLASSERELTVGQRSKVEGVLAALNLKGAAHKIWRRQVRGAATPDASPHPLVGEFPSAPFTILENGVRYEISFQEGYSVGLFLDQRDNRRALLKNYAAADFELFSGGLKGKSVLNTFAYTCGFSVCAALAGATTTSLDLSQKYLTWGQRNFALKQLPVPSNQLPVPSNEFIYGDAFNWMGRFAKKGRAFDVVILDPPTFSKSKEHGTFQAERDYGALVTAGVAVLKKNGILFASTNAAKLMPEDFLAQIKSAVQKSGRRVLQLYYAPQPPDFPASREEPAYLKTAWLRVG